MAQANKHKKLNIPNTWPNTLTHPRTQGAHPAQGPSGPKPGPSQISEDLEIWGPGNLGIWNPIKNKFECYFVSPCRSKGFSIFTSVFDVGDPPEGPPEGPSRPTRGPNRPKAQARPKPGPGQISGDLEVWGPGNLGIWNPTKNKKLNISKPKSVLPKMSARSGLVGQKTSQPHLGPFQFNFSMDRKKYNNRRFLPIFPQPGLPVEFLQ